MKAFIFGALALVTAASFGESADGQTYVQHIKQRNSHLSHPAAAHNPPLPEPYAASTQAQFIQLYEGPHQDSYTQLYGGAKQQVPLGGSDAYGQPKHEDVEYQPGYERSPQPQRPVVSEYPQPQHVFTSRTPIFYPQLTQRTTSTRRPLGIEGYQNAVEDEEGPAPGYDRPAQPQQPPTTRRPVTYPRPSTIVRRITTSRRPTGGYQQPAHDEYIQPVSTSYPQSQQRASTSRRPISSPQTTIRATATRRPTEDYLGTEPNEVDKSSYHRPSRNDLPPTPPHHPAYPRPQPAQKRPPTGAYDNELDDIDQRGYSRPWQTIQPVAVIQRPIGKYAKTDVDEVGQGGYGRPKRVPPTTSPVQKRPIGGYSSTNLEDTGRGGYGGPSRRTQNTSLDQISFPSEAQPRRIPALEPHTTPFSNNPSGNELPNPAAASFSQKDFVTGQEGSANPDYFPQVPLSRAAWSAAPAIAPIPAFSADSFNYHGSEHQPAEYVILDGGSRW